MNCKQKKKKKQKKGIASAVTFHKVDHAVVMDGLYLNTMIDIKSLKYMKNKFWAKGTGGIYH